MFGNYEGRFWKFQSRFRKLRRQPLEIAKAAFGNCEATRSTHYLKPLSSSQSSNISISLKVSTWSLMYSFRLSDPLK